MKDLSFITLFSLFLCVHIVHALTKPVKCGLDPKVNADTWSSYIDEIGFIFESACGRNR